MRALAVALAVECVCLLCLALESLAAFCEGVRMNSALLAVLIVGPLSELSTSNTRSNLTYRQDVLVCVAAVLHGLRTYTSHYLYLCNGKYLYLCTGKQVLLY